MLLVPRPLERASLESFLSCRFLNPSASAAVSTRSHGEGPGASVKNNGEENSASPDSHAKVSHDNPVATAIVERSASTRGGGDENSRTVVSRARVEKNAEDDEPEATGGTTVKNIGRRCEEREGNGEWGWDCARGAADVGVGRHEGCTIVEEGPLPALPLLPSTLEPLAAARSGGDDVKPGVSGGGNGDGGAGPTPDLALDLAFVASNHVENHDEPSQVQRPGRGSSADGVPPAGAPGVKGLDVDRSRRKYSSADTAGTSAAAAAPALVSPKHQRSRSGSFSGRDSPTSIERRERASTFSTSPYRGITRVQRRRSGSGSGSGSGNGSDGGGIGPEPVFYLGKEGSVPGASLTSPNHPRHTPAPIRRASSGRAGFSTPTSSLYYSGDSGDGGGCVAADGRILHSSSSPSKARSRGSGNDTLVAHEHNPLPDSDEHVPGGRSATLEDGSYQPHHQSPTGLVVGNDIGSGGGGAMASPDGGGPMITTKYPSLRGGDSLLTIPEDSTGFVLVTRPPSSISCEHGPGCECWAWGGGGGNGEGGGIATMRSPSASYLAAVNPYGGPGKTGRAPGAGAGAAVTERRSGPGAFLGSVGNMWNTAMNTFRGVAGAQGRIPSWPATRSGRSSQKHQQQPQQRGSLPKSSQKPAATAAAITCGFSSTTATGGPGATGSSPLVSPREQMSPVSAQFRMMGGEGSSSGNSSNSSGGVGGSSRGGGGNRGSRGAPAGVVGAGISSGNNSRNMLLYQQSALPFTDKNSRRPEALSSVGGFPPPLRFRDTDPRRLSHHRRHSEPITPSPSPAGKEGKGGGGNIHADGKYTGIDGRDTLGGGRARSFDTHFEDSDSRRLMSTAERAEVVGKRSILLVTLADKTAQEAMSLTLESPRDARAVAPPAPWPVPTLGAEQRTGCKFDKFAKGEVAYARRRHGMLTEALSLYVKVLAILQGALPGVLVECEGVSTEGLAAWNPLIAEPNQGYEKRFNRSPKVSPSNQHRQQQRVGHPSPPSSSLLNQRSALVTKASWLKDIFSQTLQRAEHCRDQVTEAAVAAEAVVVTKTMKTDAQTAFDMAAVPLASASPVMTQFPKESMGLTPPADTAAAAVFRSAMEHGQEAEVCNLLGQSDAAVTHYVRACALLRLLALEPEMSGVREMVSHQSQEQQNLGGWQEQLLQMAEGYAQRVETISIGEWNIKGEQAGAVRVLEGGTEDVVAAGERRRCPTG